MTHGGLGWLFASAIIAVCFGKSSYPVPMTSIVILYYPLVIVCFPLEIITFSKFLNVFFKMLQFDSFLFYFLGIAHGATIRRLNPSTSLESPATVTVDVGSKLAVSCSELGGTVRWYGPDGEPVVTGDGVQVRGTTSVQVLIFTSYQSSQGGQYECRSRKDGTKDTQIVRFGE